jgi:ribose transport system ATP-binding protein
MKAPAAQPSVTAGGPVLEAVGLSKSFPPVEVLKDVSLAVNPGEVHLSSARTEPASPLS